MTIEQSPPRSELAAALCYFFGAGLRGRVDGRRLHARYRELAFACHPDRAAAIGRDRQDLAEEFERVQSTYEILRTIIEGQAAVQLRTSWPPEGGPYLGTDQRATERRRAPPGSGAVRLGVGRPGRTLAGLPVGGQLGFGSGRKTSFGHFLYYAGRISWRQLLDVRLWQRRSRPQVGRIASEWGMLEAPQITDLLESQTGRRRFCDLAVERGMLQPIQRLAVLGRQRMLAPALEHFLLGQGWLDASDLAGLRHQAAAQGIELEAA